MARLRRGSGEARTMVSGESSRRSPLVLPSQPRSRRSVQIWDIGSSPTSSLSLEGQLGMDWKEVRRLAGRPEYRILAECNALVREAANELKLKSSLDPD